MAGRIFINYRRGDEPGFAGRLFDRLEAAFAPDQLFMDVDNIPAGHDFVAVLENEVAKCDVLLAIIGKGWIDAQDETGTRRLDNPKDFVRIEIESGLKQGKRVIPVLVNNADMPRADELPEPLKPLSRRNAVRLTHDRFKADAQGLVKVLETALEESEAARTARTEAERKAAEDVLRRRHAEEAARAAEAERLAVERARQQAVAGLSPDEIRKAEELANWSFVERSLSRTGDADASAHVAELRNHLARFPGGTTERYARTELEELVWGRLGPAPEETHVEAYLSEFPTGKYVAEAKSRLGLLKDMANAAREAEELKRRETDAWAKASGDDTLEEYLRFLEQWPDSLRAQTAAKRIRELQPRNNVVADPYWIGATKFDEFLGFRVDKLRERLKPDMHDQNIQCDESVPSADPRWEGASNLEKFLGIRWKK